MKKNDREAFGELYKRYGHLVLGLCIKYLKDKDAASDAVMSIFTKLFEDLKRFEITHFKSWLYVYSKNYCLMELRKKQRLLREEITGTAESILRIMENSGVEHLNEQSLTEQEQRLLLLEKAISELGVEQKRCIEMYYYKNCSYIEIATSTGYSEKEVKSHLQNGKRNLKIKLEKLDGNLE